MTSLATIEKNNLQYRGDLADTTLPEILNTIDRFQVPGVIETERDGVVKHVFVREGCVVHATSSDRNDSLGHFLLRSGKLSQDQFDVTMHERAHRDARFGVLLVEAGILSPREVNEAIRQHVEEIVWSLFYWQEGKVSFAIGAPPEDEQVRIQLPMRQVVLEGIKRAPSAKTLVARLGRRDTVFAPSYHAEALIDLALDADDHRLLTLVDGRRTLYEVCTAGPHLPADNAKLMYAFHVLQLIRRVQVEENAPAGGSRRESSGAIRIRMKTPGVAFPD